jgi:ribosomal protein L7Ae-like RNA K-turn-binding protein
MCNSHTNENSEKLLRLLGLAARAGKLVYGTPMVCEELKKGNKVYFVFEANGTSENTHKRIGDRCRFYNARLIGLGLNTEEFAHLLGKSGELAVAALTDASFAQGIEKLI